MILVGMSFIKKITESGVAFTELKAEQRNIILTNYISLVAAMGTILLFVGRSMFAHVTWSIAFTLIQGSALFLVPIVLNRFGYINFSRLALCWLPPLYQIYATVRTMSETLEFENSTYVGLRFFLLAFSCFPFLVFDLKKTGIFVIALLGPLTCLFLFDPILTWFDYGYHQMGLNETTYDFNNVRVFISVMIIGSSSFFLKSLIEKNEAINEKLVSELAEKNAQLRAQTETEVHQLNQLLYSNLQQLSEREFILNQSQRIAKVGSWNRRIDEKQVFWSDEMYNIFGVSRDFDLANFDLSKLFLGAQLELLQGVNAKLWSTGEPYDLIVQTKTPIGYNKWIRVWGFPIREGDKVVGASGICHDITFYKEAEELLKSKEGKYRQLFEQASDAILVSDFHGNITDVNTSLLNMLGYEREELINTPLANLIEPENLRANPMPMEKLINGEHIFSERAMVHKNGLILLVEANVKASGDDKIMAIIREVTELRAVQRQVQISEARFRGAFEDSGIGMALVALSGKWMKVNRAFCAMTGYEEDELLGLSFQDITHPDDLTQDRDILMHFAEGKGGIFRFEKRYIHKKGSIIWANLNVSIIRDNAGEPLYFVAQIEDITDEKKAREKLILSEANLNATINNTEIFIWSIDRSFNLLTFNKPFADYIKEQYGITVERGKNLMVMIDTPESRELIEKWSEIYMRALSGEVVTLDETIFGKDFKYSVSPIIENTKVMGVSIFADNVTERKARDRELADAQRKIGELKLMALRSVMNPHFVFNVLNSIQYFIAKNDRINAINYLSTFSKLIRSVLTHSVNNKIKLTEEIEMLKNYVHLEMTRFENKFSFDLQVDENVEVDNIEIPALLVQPYVENAILHGLYNKIGQGQLTIRVKEKNDAVFFEIEDDGIGREEARKLRSQNLPMHKSMGIKLTEERLKLINEAHNVAFEIQDLKNGDKPLGTKVTIGVKF
jgi:PAS domain S-box-containing protein